MDEFVKCWHCTHYIWFSVKEDNTFAICDIKNQCVADIDEVCKYFILSKGIITKKSIPDYCMHYNAHHKF